MYSIFSEKLQAQTKKPPRPSTPSRIVISDESDDVS